MNRVQKSQKINPLWYGLSIVYPIVFLLAITYFFAGFVPFYDYQFERNGIMEATGLNQNDLDAAKVHLATYITGFRADLNHQVTLDGERQWIYGEREILHMVDVRHIFDGIRMGVLGFVVVAGGTLMILRQRANRDFPGQSKWQFTMGHLRMMSRFGFWGTLVIAGLLGVLVTMDFSQYFYKFHEVFFSNDLWLLDPETDVLIQMLPEVFFRDIALAVLLTTLGLQWLIALAMKQFLRLGGRK